MAPLLDVSPVAGGRSPVPIANSGGARSARPASPGAAGSLRMDRVPAADDTDTATRQTVEMMCDYIRKAAADPFVQQCANTAWRRFGKSSPDLNMKAWACFWWVKHCIKFRLDEATMFQVGEENQQDFLLSPSVLFRMKNPAEDCDGFTMAEAVLLVCLGVPVVIATVAASADEPKRWSHVFPVSVIHGRPLPLDASHGVGPGWMVPPKNMYRWQAWDLNAKPVNIRPAKFQGLHGYVRTGGAPQARPMMPRSMYRRRGIGDLCSDYGIGCDITAPDILPTVTSSSPDGSYLQWGTPSTGSSSSTTSGGLFSFLSSLVSNAANVAKVAVTPTTTVTYPGGATVSGPAGSVPLTGLSSSSLLPIVGVGILALVLVGMGKK